MMRATKIFLLVFFTLSFFAATAQQKYNESLLDTLQQIASSNTTAKYFAQLYYNTITATNSYAATKPDSVKDFIFGFESLFAPAFFNSYQNFISHRPQTYEWEQYYSDTTLTALQYHFIGMNAHINGDMWRCLKDKYGYDTLKKYRKELLHFQKTLNSVFDSMYTTSRQYKKVRTLHLITVGMDKIMGRQMILHWRKRQVRLALQYYRHPQKCRRKIKYMHQRMQRYNHFAVHWIK